MVTVTVEVNIKVTVVKTAVCQRAQISPCPASIHPRGRNVTKLNCSFFSVRKARQTLWEYTKSLPQTQSLSPSAVEFGTIKISLWLPLGVCVSVVSFTESSDARWPRASQTPGLWGCLTVVIYPDLARKR